MKASRRRAIQVGERVHSLRALSNFDDSRKWIGFRTKERVAPIQTNSLVFAEMLYGKLTYGCGTELGAGLARVRAPGPYVAQWH